MNEPTLAPSRTRLPLPENIRLVLDRLVRKELLAKVLRFPLLAIIVLLWLWVLEALVDLVFNLSWSARLGFLVASAALAGWLFYRHVIIPCRRRLNLRSAALLVERKFPQFRTSLISVMDFTIGSGVAQGSVPLIQTLIGQVSRLVDRTEIVRGIVDMRPVRRLLTGALVTVVAVGGIVWFFQPQSLVLLRRVFLSSERLPSRTTVEPLTADFTIDTGSNVELAARARGLVPRNGRVVVIHADGRREAVPVSVNPADPGVFRLTLRNILQPFRYHFEINDGASADFEVKTRTLPSLASTRFIYFPASYTGRPQTDLPSGSLSLLAGSKLVIEGEATQPLRSAVLELKGLNQTIRMDNGDATENLRARLAASEPKMKELQTRMDELRPKVDAAEAEEKSAQQATDEARKALDATPEGDLRRQRGREFEKVANVLLTARGDAERMRSQFNQTKREWEGVKNQAEDEKKQLANAEAQPAPDKETAAKQKRIVRAEILIPKEGLNGLSMHLVNEEGLASENAPVYRVNLTADKPPTVEITEPRSDKKTILPEDKVTLKFRARDDYRIERLSLRYVVLRPNAEGEAVPAEEQTLPLPFPAGATNVSSGYAWDLSSFIPPLTEGCSVTYWIEAADHYTLYSPGAGISRKMILTVVSPEEKKAELLKEMEEAARKIERLSGIQRKTNEKTDANIRR